MLLISKLLISQDSIQVYIKPDCISSVGQQKITNSKYFLPVRDNLQVVH